MRIRASSHLQAEHDTQQSCFHRNLCRIDFGSGEKKHLVGDDDSKAECGQAEEVNLTLTTSTNSPLCALNKCCTRMNKFMAKVDIKQCRSGASQKNHFRTQTMVNVAKQYSEQQE